MLPRRAFLGIDLEGKPVPGGVRIQSVHAESPADRAGLRAHDLVVSVNGRAVLEPDDVTRAIRQATGTDVSIVARRENANRDYRLSFEPMPIERLAEGRVVLGEVRVGESSLRTIVTIPNGAPPFPAVLFLQGIDVRSCEHPFEPEHPAFRLVESCTGGGFVTMRVERGGVGDSEGRPPSECGLSIETATANAALEALLSEEVVDPARIFVFGTSLGGMIAPLCAGISHARAVAVFGTSSRRWRACAVGSTERQLKLRGYDGEELAERLALWAEMHAAVCRDGLSPAQAMERKPHLAVLHSRECRGDTLFGHSSAFFRELDATDLRAAWTHCDRDVLVIRGEYDWVCDAEDAESVALACGPRARLVELPRIGHDMRSHLSIEASRANPSEGTWDGSVADVTLDWMRSLPKATS